MLAITKPTLSTSDRGKPCCLPQHSLSNKAPHCSHGDQGKPRKDDDSRGSTANGQHVSLQPTGRRRRTYPSTKWREPPSGTATLADNMAARHTPNAAATLVAEWGYLPTPAAGTDPTAAANPARSPQPTDGADPPVANLRHRGAHAAPLAGRTSEWTPPVKDSNPLQTSRQHSKHHSGHLMSPEVDRLV